MFIVFFFNDTATTEIYTLSLHDALPIFTPDAAETVFAPADGVVIGVEELYEHRFLHTDAVRLAIAVSPLDVPVHRSPVAGDRKSTRLNSSHANISYAVFCLKKKKYIYL